jgi:hypothetical protein
MAARLAHLEREVEAARHKLASDLAAIRSPDGFGELRSTLKHAASELRDDAEDRALSIASGVVEKLKAKAAANPAALLAIGAGLLWHFAKRPPVTATLLGIGLLNLMRTPVPAEGRRSGNGFLNEAGGNLVRQAGEALDAVGEAGLGAVDAGWDKASVLAADVGKRVEGMAGTATASMRAGAKRARDATLELGETVVEATREGMAAAHDATSDLTARSIKAARELVGKDAHEQDERLSAAASSRSNGHSHSEQYGAPDDYFEDMPDDEDQDEETIRDRPSIPVDTLLLSGAGLAVAATCALVLFRRDTAPTPTKTMARRRSPKRTASSSVTNGKRRR